MYLVCVCQSFCCCLLLLQSLVVTSYILFSWNLMACPSRINTNVYKKVYSWKVIGKLHVPIYLFEQYLVQRHIERKENRKASEKKAKAKEKWLNWNLYKEIANVYIIHIWIIRFLLNIAIELAGKRHTILADWPLSLVLYEGYAIYDTCACVLCIHQYWVHTTCVCVCACMWVQCKLHKIPPAYEIFLISRQFCIAVMVLLIPSHLGIHGIHFLVHFTDNSFSVDIIHKV